MSNGLRCAARWAPLSAALIPLVAIGCATVTAVHTIAPAGLVRSSRRDRDALSASSAYALNSLGIAGDAPINPEQALEALDASAADPRQPAFRLAVAELHHIAGSRIGRPARELSRHDYLAAVAASEILFGAPASQAFAPDPDQLGQARVIHDLALERFLKRSADGPFIIDRRFVEKLEAEETPIAVSTSNNLWNPTWFHKIMFCDDYRISGMRRRIKSPGVGVSAFGIRDFRGDKDRAGDPGEAYYPPIQVYPATLILKPSAAKGEPPSLEFHDPNRFDAIEGNARTLLLAADRTTPIAFHFARGSLAVAEQIGLFRPQDFGARAGLYMPHPYEPGKIPVVFIHGLWSSPRAFVQSLNELRGDVLIRSRFQFWFYIYPSGDPYTYTASLLRESLEKVRNDLDPRRRDPALDRMVLVGHSMGGLLAKMTVQESRDVIWNVLSTKRFDEIAVSDPSRERLRKIFFYEPNRSVKRVVFLATPHRGSKLGDNWIGRIGSSLIKRPPDLEALHHELLELNGPEAFRDVARRKDLVSSIDLLRDHDPTLVALDSLPIAPWVKYHSVIGNITGGADETGGDGVVLYSSAHIQGAASELVIPRSHFLQDDELTIAELRRILFEHAGISRPDFNPPQGAGPNSSAGAAAAPAAGPMRLPLVEIEPGT